MSDLTMLTAREMMTTRFLRLNKNMDIYEAVDLLLANHMANAPVVDDEDRIIGFLSEKDCMRCMLEGAYDSNPSTSVENCMSRVTKTVQEETDILTIADMFLQTAYRRIPVVRGQRLVGLISRRDLLKAMAAQTKPIPNRPRGPSYLYLSNIADKSALPMV